VGFPESVLWMPCILRTWGLGIGDWGLVIGRQSIISRVVLRMDERIIPMRQRLRLGLVGCGDFGKYIAPYFLEVADIAALCDVNAAGMEETAKALGLDVPHSTDYREMFAAGGLDAVVVTAANFVHAEITVAAAEAGLHVFCEKAMARTVPECWEMVRACQKNHVKLMIGHKRRLRTPWARMIELTDGALLGAVLAVTVTQYGCVAMPGRCRLCTGPSTIRATNIPTWCTPRFNSSPGLWPVSTVGCPIRCTSFGSLRGPGASVGTAALS